MTVGVFAVIILIVAAVCLWQLLAGLSKMRQAKANPGDPMAATYARMGRIQALVGGGMLALNVLLNLPTVLAIYGFTA